MEVHETMASLCDKQGSARHLLSTACLQLFPGGDLARPPESEGRSGDFSAHPCIAWKSSELRTNALDVPSDLRPTPAGGPDGRVEAARE